MLVGDDKDVDGGEVEDVSEAEANISAVKSRLCDTITQT